VLNAKVKDDHLSLLAENFPGTHIAKVSVSNSKGRTLSRVISNFGILLDHFNNKTLRRRKRKG